MSKKKTESCWSRRTSADDEERRRIRLADRAAVNNQCHTEQRHRVNAILQQEAKKLSSLKYYKAATANNSGRDERTRQEIATEDQRSTRTRTSTQTKPELVPRNMS
ncbi:hypothetical protein BV898_16656 [Hypsibius exemplaris]|uniref:Uncharacterized protein n=1 Tax=Hypsibius exemplaris TaxID=2072580 RepID=A0A9X6NDM2_HYPEX|nr:hypothetical protein BV898_16656 [Hypsibius exemplaris]